MGIYFLLLAKFIVDINIDKCLVHIEKRALEKYVNTFFLGKSRGNSGIKCISVSVSPIKMTSAVLDISSGKWKDRQTEAQFIFFYFFCFCVLCRKPHALAKILKSQTEISILFIRNYQLFICCRKTPYSDLFIRHYDVA